jgi:hypothetical protein
MSNATFHRGDIVRDIYGAEHEVMAHTGCMVVFYDGSWAHPTKCWLVTPYWLR